jgi:hypothetical protein
MFVIFFLVAFLRMGTVGLPENNQDAAKCYKKVLCRGGDVQSQSSEVI